MNDINNYLLIGSSMILISIGIYALFHRKVSGAFPIFIQTLVAAIWTIGSYFEINSTGLEAKILWRNIQQIGVFIVPIASVFFAVDYSRQSKLKKYVYILAIIPITSIILIFTNEFHHIMRSGYSISEHSITGESLVVHSTNVGLLLVEINFFIPFIAAMILFDFRKKVSKHFKKQVSLIIISVVLRQFISLIKPIYIDKIGVYIPIALFYIPSALILFYCVFKDNFFSLSPIARDKVFDIISESILVIDGEGTVVDKNSHAVALGEKYLNIKKELIGMNIEEVFTNKSKIYDMLIKKQDSTFEIELEDTDGSIYLLLSTHSLDPNHGEQIGTVLMISDITEKKRYELSLIAKAERDSLTHLLNRGGFMSASRKVLNESIECSNPVSVFMLDIDYFKKINDTFGHGNGDKVIKNLARILRENLREKDIIGRMGGEEFAVVMPKTSKNEAYTIAERIRKKVEKNSILISNAQSIKYTISIGIHDNAQSNLSIEELLHEADMALYDAKKQSRNCTLVRNLQPIEIIEI